MTVMGTASGHGYFRNDHHRGNPPGKQCSGQISILDGAMFSYRASSSPQRRAGERAPQQKDALSRVNDSTLLQWSAAIADLLYMTWSFCFCPALVSQSCNPALNDRQLNMKRTAEVQFKKPLQTDIKLWVKDLTIVYIFQHILFAYSN